MNKIIFTSDVDWAPELVILDMVDLFQKYGAKCTFFATHKSDILLSLKKEDFEIGIHPNFNEQINGNSKGITGQQIVDQLLEIYPESKGTRSHSLTQSSPLLEIFKKSGLLYESNQFVPYQRVQPFKLWNDLIRIPYNWEDDVHWSYGKKFNSTEIDLNESIIIADFHPIHVFLNTESQERYNQAKKYYQSPSELAKFQNKTGLGVRTLLIDLLETQKRLNTSSLTLTEFAETATHFVI
jgi:hypothetical protein